MIKTCINCNETKDESFFYFRKDKQKYRTECKNCSSQLANKWQRKNKFYKLFDSIKQRCYNKNNQDYHNYGGRGIKCKLKSHKDLSYLGPKPNEYSIDRIDVNGHYEIGNLRWATPKQQANNRRK